MASRALLSIAPVAMVLVLIVFIPSVKALFRQPMVAWSFVPLLLFLTGWYQAPLHLETYDYLLTLLMYPIAALAGCCYISKNAKIYQYAWLIVGGLSLLYPAFWYINHATEVNAAYGRGQSLPTFMSGDHIRYGLFLNSMLLIGATIPTRRYILRNVLLLLLVAIIVIMAVRTAWISMIIIIMFAAFAKTIEARRLFKGLLAALIPIAIAAYLVVPTVKQKVNYALYDHQQYQQQQDISYSDGVRRSINTAAWKSITEDKAGGAGWAAVPANIQQRYTKVYGAPPPFNWPFNQWLFWWMGGGLVAVILFSCWLLYPVWWGFKNNNAAVACWTLVIAASCMVESTLSLQYGVLVHVWPLALLWKHKPSISETSEGKNC